MLNWDKHYKGSLKYMISEHSLYSYQIYFNDHIKNSEGFSKDFKLLRIYSNGLGKEIYRISSDSLIALEKAALEFHKKYGKE